SVQIEESFRTHISGALVAVEETMIARQPKRVRRGQRRRVGITVCHLVARSCQSRLDNSQVADSPNSAVLCHLFVMNGKDSFERNPSPPSRFHLASSRNAF